MDDQTRSPPRKRAKIVKMPSSQEELEEESPDAMEQAAKAIKGYFLFCVSCMYLCFVLRFCVK